MEIISGGAALCTASERWGVPVCVLEGKGPGRHPVTSPDDSDRCSTCGQYPEHVVHRAPRRRSCAAFVRAATLARQKSRK